MKMKKKTPAPSIRDIEMTELRAILERVRSALGEDAHGKLCAVVETMAYLQEVIRSKSASIGRLKKLLFGARTEKTRQLLGEGDSRSKTNRPAADASSGKVRSDVSPAKRKGHGRNGVSAYTGAKRIPVTHACLHHGDRCPACKQGNVYEQSQPSMLVRVIAMAPVQADIYACDRLRCGACGEVFTAKPPAGVGEKKYDESVSAMVSVFKYGAGMPFNRLEKLQAALGIPLPVGTQWELIEEAVEPAAVAFKELVRQAAQAEVLHNDDTPMKILNSSMTADAQARERRRTGMFTTGIIAKAGKLRMALFYTGRNHAGENLAEVLSHREKELAAPIQMCDALSRNTAGDFVTIVANCIAHARRRFVDVVENFPDECRYVLETLSQVYRNDAIARENKMSPEERLRFHKERSSSCMENLQMWLQEQFDTHKVEPNSGLGEAIQYMQNHWQELTLFLRKPGAPLDNNICERGLKKAILHRKNSYFFKTENGARAGDIFMSLIHTTELNNENPFEYLVALQRHATSVRKNPGDWMPWNFRETQTSLQSSSSGSDPPH